MTNCLEGDFYDVKSNCMVFIDMLEAISSILGSLAVLYALGLKTIREYKKSQLLPR